jgi:hypothetical protein
VFASRLADSIWKHDASRPAKSLEAFRVEAAGVEPVWG